MTTGVIRIEFQIDDQNQLKIMVHGPMKDQAEKDLTVTIMSQAIPIVTNYRPSPIIVPQANGNSKPLVH